MIDKQRKKIKLFALFTILVVIGLTSTSCEGPMGSMGPMGSQGQKGEKGDPGEDGNANVTRYLFNGHDFTVNSIASRFIELENQEEMLASTWLTYLVHTNSFVNHIPGRIIEQGHTSEYFVSHVWRPSGSEMQIDIFRDSESIGSEYDEIHIIRIEGTNVVDNRSKMAGSAIPGDLDITDYHAVLDYFGLPE